MFFVSPASCPVFMGQEAYATASQQRSFPGAGPDAATTQRDATKRWTRQTLIVRLLQ
jgi:hypothetical protein